ncbi:hypothetical protein RFI_02755 [Reticulomyxa filosa]|uniref:Uncharacterized protein n=1 Tax=Reticulomyxa filosa TaxID=46433 RepID=X6P8E3_RETFI|nr:hypothetical protein RFI_02755 [Reticulomyxa filosa]|eukprot:ETO34339.1 hypothetical protein RFI_02755 [Reticulomyxa filosa]
MLRDEELFIRTGGYPKYFVNTDVQGLTSISPEDNVSSNPMDCDLDELDIQDDNDNDNDNDNDYKEDIDRIAPIFKANANSENHTTTAREQKSREELPLKTKEMEPSPRQSDVNGSDRACSNETNLKDSNNNASVQTCKDNRTEPFQTIKTEDQQRKRNAIQLVEELLSFFEEVARRGTCAMSRGKLVKTPFGFGELLQTEEEKEEASHCLVQFPTMNAYIKKQSAQK